MRGLAAVAGLLVGCYAPGPHPGSACVNGQCGAGLVCAAETQICELAPNDSGVPGGENYDDGGFSGFEDAPPILIDGCSPSPEICGDGIDQDCTGGDATCPPNDLASGAIDVTAGGNFTANLAAAHDNNAGTCGGTGGRDVFYKITLTAAQVYYFDTFGSSFDTVVRVYAGACTAIAATPTMCVDDSCAGKQSQLAVSLASGTSCIVVDQKSSAETAGSVHLAVTPGGRNGTLLATGPQTNAGNTCTATSIEDPDIGCADPGSKDIGYFFTNCPGSNRLLDAATCVGSDPDFDSAIYVRHATTELACSDDDCGIALSMFADAPITMGGLYWMIVDGYSPGDCGAYTLTTNLR